MDELHQRLKALFEARCAKARNHEEVNFAEDGGKQLYDDALDEILKMIETIRKEFFRRVNRCDLFGHIEEGKWRKDFKENFYKLFIDRDCCEDFEDEVRNYSQFNDANIGGAGNAFGADVCYGEAMAVGFLFMLKELHKKFENDQRKGNTSPISEEDFFRLLHKFNAIATVNDGNENNIAINSTGIFKYDDALKFREEFGDFSKVFYDFPNSFITIAFYQNFPHQKFAQEYYQKYLEGLSECRNNPEKHLSLIYQLSVSLSSNVHLAKDGNGRAATLMGWLMALDANQLFPVAIAPYFSDRGVFDEAHNFVRKLMEDPTIHSSDDEALSFKGRAMENHNADSLIQFLSFFHENLLFCIGERIGDLVFLGKAIHTGDLKVITYDRSELNGGEEIEILNPSLLKEALEESAEAINEEGDLDEEVAKIIICFMKKIVEIAQDDSLSKAKKLTTEELQTFLHINKFFEDKVLSEEFVRLRALCLAIIPVQAPKVSPNAESANPLTTSAQHYEI